MSAQTAEEMRERMHREALEACPLPHPTSEPIEAIVGELTRYDREDGSVHYYVTWIATLFDSERVLYDLMTETWRSHVFEVRLRLPWGEVRWRRDGPDGPR